MASHDDQMKRVDSHGLCFCSVVVVSDWIPRMPLWPAGRVWNITWWGGGSHGCLHIMYWIVLLVIGWCCARRGLWMW